MSKAAVPLAPAPLSAPSPGAPSLVHLDEFVSPDRVDEHGCLRAGQILEWMDVVGVLAAARHCRMPVVTASVDGLELREPIPLASSLTMKGVVAHTSDRSIGISVTMQHSHAKRPAQLVQGYMTFVAMDPNNSVSKVPPFRPETAEEVQRFREGDLRREFRKTLASSTGSIVADLVESGTSTRPDSFLLREVLNFLPKSFRLPWDRTDKAAPRARHTSYIHTVEPVRLSDLNFHQTLYGGTLMKWLENSAGLSARAFLRGNAARLTSLHGLTFLRPVHANAFVHLRSTVVHVDSAQLTVLSSVEAENPIDGEIFETLRAFLSFRPVDDGLAIPRLEIAGATEMALFREAEQRLALQKLLAGA